MASRRLSERDRSAFFFAGWFTPSELANFNIQNHFLPEGGVLEMLGHYVGVWWGTKLARDFEDLRDVTRDWLETIAAAFYLENDVALGVRLSFWVEALDVEVEEAVLGFMDDRFRVVRAPEVSDEASAPMREAIKIATDLRGQRHVQPAAKEVWRAALDPSDEAFLSAFRALECLRRLYGPGDSAEDIKDAWKSLQVDLGAAAGPYEVLRAAAKAVRHGDRPASSTDEHPVNDARKQRPELLVYAKSLVATAIANR